jgi:hypothetical protein
MGAILQGANRAFVSSKPLAIIMFQFWLGRGSQGGGGERSPRRGPPNCTPANQNTFRFVPIFEHINPMNGTPKWPDWRWNPYFGPWSGTITQPIIENTKRRILKTLLYPPYKKHTFPNAQIEVFKWWPHCQWSHSKTPPYLSGE